MADFKIGDKVRSIRGSHSTYTVCGVHGKSLWVSSVEYPNLSPFTVAVDVVELAPAFKPIERWLYVSSEGWTGDIIYEELPSTFGGTGTYVKVTVAPA